MRMRVLGALCALAAMGCSVAAQGYHVEAAPEWTALFERTSGWLAADGIFSIPLSGDDSFGSASETQTAFVFSDTLIGRVVEGQLQGGAAFVNNTLALLNGAEPDSSRIQFHYARDAQGRPRSVFIPQTPNAQPGDWYWLGDAVVINGKVHVVALRMRSANDPDAGIFNFITAGAALITLPVTSRPPFSDQRQVEAPIFLPKTQTRGDVIFGAGIYNNTSEAGAPNPDGYVYIYGTQNDPFNKRLLVGRVRPNDFENVSAWRFWSGTGWVSGVQNARPITDRVSNELSVTPLPNGQYALVFQLDALGHEVAARVSNSLTGPWGPVIRLWRAPEVDMDDDIVVYNAKAHPHLSRPGELLISYNVNSTDFFGDFAQLATYYRPRFIRVVFD